MPHEALLASRGELLERLAGYLLESDRCRHVLVRTDAGTIVQPPRLNQHPNGNACRNQVVQPLNSVAVLYDLIAARVAIGVLVQTWRLHNGPGARADQDMAAGGRFEEISGKALEELASRGKERLMRHWIDVAMAGAGHEPTAGLDRGPTAGLDRGPTAGLDRGPTAGLKPGPIARADSGRTAGDDRGANLL